GGAWHSARRCVNSKHNPAFARVSSVVFCVTPRSSHRRSIQRIHNFADWRRNYLCMRNNEAARGLGTRREVCMSLITDGTHTLQDVDVNVVLMIRNEYGEQ